MRFPVFRDSKKEAFLSSHLLCMELHSIFRVNEANKLKSISGHAEINILHKHVKKIFHLLFSIVLSILLALFVSCVNACVHEWPFVLLCDIPEFNGNPFLYFPYLIIW